MRQAILVCFCLLHFYSEAQTPPAEAWVATYDGTVKNFERGNGIAVDNQGNVYVTGYSSRNGVTSDNTIIPIGDIKTIKYNKAGQQLWVSTYNGPPDLEDIGVSIALDGAGNVYVSGTSERASKNTDIVVIKYNNNGVEQWVSRYNGPGNGNDKANALAVDPQGNAYVTGSQDGDEQNDGTDIVTLRYNSQGALQWAKSYAGAAGKEDEAKTIALPGDGYVYIAGSLVETTSSDYLLIKYSIEGNVAWIGWYDGPVKGSDLINDIDVDAAGNVYITGTSQSEDGRFGTINMDYCTIKYDANGNQKWNRRYDQDQNKDVATSIEVDASGNVFVNGSSYKDGTLDYLTIKYDGANGNHIWGDRFYVENGCGEVPYDMVMDAEGSVYITGSANRAGNCYLTDYATVKYKSNGTREWVKFYAGPALENRARAIALDNKGNVYVTGSSLLSGSVSNGDAEYVIVTVKYAKCTINCPADVTVNTAEGQCGAIVTYAAATVNGICGALQYSQASKTFFPVGTTPVTVSSPVTGESCTFNVIVKDVELPKITAPANVTVSCAADVPAANTSAVTATDNCGTPTVTHVSDVVSNKTCANRFTITRTYKATDASGNTATATQIITVNDNTAPQIIGLSVSQQSLWPANHTLRDISLNYTVLDNCVNDPNVTVTITSNEPVNGAADGDTDPDWVVVDLHHIQLRAERAANGNGRIYTITVTVNDGCNPPVSQSKQVLVAHNIHGPQSGLPFKVGTTVSFGGTFWDQAGKTHTAKWLLDGSAAANGIVTEPAATQHGKVSGAYKFNTPGVYKLQMNITDQTGLTSYTNINNDLDAIVVIYDPNGGNAFGGGWYQSPAGALLSNSSATGKASFGFAVNYANPAKPKGETQFEFKVGNFEFNALNFDYLAIGGAKAQFRGTGKIIGGQSGIGFIMTVKDGALDGSGVDKIRMKIYNRNTQQVYYDNQPGASDADDPLTVVGNNSTVVIQNSQAINPQAITTSSATKEIPQDVRKIVTSENLQLLAYPNPSSQDFSIQLTTPDPSTKLQLQVYDQNGKMLEKRENITPGSIIKLGQEYRPGIYYLRVTQGGKSKEAKLIKLIK